ncbi:phenylalanine ammonia-lyase [Puccinia sorghi]|uniref:Phenylalanine ammonia-lyase n=1 Tax=Puccinia sorghi TaxID=27349 RepID=A0A0L6VEY6_9BASI|nr:phenylalanine ammonia-lyase [Puccinia sorghi]
MDINHYCLLKALDPIVFELRFNKMLGALFLEAVTESFGTQLSKGSIEGMVMGIIDLFWYFQEKIWIQSMVLVDRFIRLLAKLIISCLASWRTQGLDHQMVNYLGVSQLLWSFFQYF